MFLLLGNGDGDISSILLGISFLFFFFLFLSVICLCFSILLPLYSFLTIKGETDKMVWKHSWFKAYLLLILLRGSFSNIYFSNYKVDFEIPFFYGILKSILAFIFL